MIEVIAEALAGLLFEYDELDQKELLVGAPAHKEGQAEIGILVDGKPYTIYIRAGERK